MPSKKKITQGVGLLLCSVGLGTVLFSSTTLAQWKDNTSISQTVITTGDVNGSTVGSSQWINTSNPTAGQVVSPGETIQGKQGLDLALDGDNVLVRPTVQLTDGAGNVVSPSSDFSISYRVLNASGAAITNATPINAQSAVFIKKSDLVSSVLDGTLDVTAEVSITLSANATTNPPTTFQIRLDQVR